MTKIILEAVVTEGDARRRLDQVAASVFSEYSRARLQEWIKAGCLKVNGQRCRPKDLVSLGDCLVVNAETKETGEWESEKMLLDIVYEDDSLIVVNKAKNLVVHPAAGHREGTLLNGLLHHFPDLRQLPRAGIIHRLDKDTTGLLMVAKTLAAHSDLVAKLARREVSREYEAIACGVLTGGGTIDLPLGRHTVNRKKRAVTENGQEAITHYKVIKRFRSHTHLLIKLETGRTHQIRVHMSYKGYPLIGDQLYGARLSLPAGCELSLAESLKSFQRQALHARRLGVSHPETEEMMYWEADLPNDITALVGKLEKDASMVGSDA
jgi:23S rRNA pseudouridine1911/1915/1917 synthase